VVNSIRQGDRIERVTIIRNGQAANAFRADQDFFDRLRRQAEAEIAGRAQVQRSADIAKINSEYPNSTLTSSGIHYIIQSQGTGGKPAPGRNVRVSYTGRLLSGTVFDRSDLRGGPLEFQVGTGRVIPGLDETVLDMRLGEKRLVIIPPELAYKDQEVGNGIIPANSFLVFEMELVSIR